MTSFFADDIPPTFESQRQLLESYPEWKLNIRLSFSNWLVNRAEEGDKSYQRYVELIENEPENFIFDTIEEGMQRINKNGKIAVLVGTKSIRKYFKDNPFDLRPQILTFLMGTMRVKTSF